MAHTEARKGGLLKIIILVFLCAAVLCVFCILLTGLFLVSITWTHRPDLSIVDILREAVREILKTIVKAVRHRGGGKESE